MTFKEAALQQFCPKYHKAGLLLLMENGVFDEDILLHDIIGAKILELKEKEENTTMATNGKKGKVKSPKVQKIISTCTTTKKASSSVSPKIVSPKMVSTKMVSPKMVSPKMVSPKMVSPKSNSIGKSQKTLLDLFARIEVPKNIDNGPTSISLSSDSDDDGKECEASEEYYSLNPTHHFVMH